MKYRSLWNNIIQNTFDKKYEIKNIGKSKTLSI